MRTSTKMALVALLMVGLMMGLMGCAYRRPVTGYNFGDGYSIRVWWQYSAIWDWDDGEEPHLLYDVTLNGQSVMPKGYLGSRLDKEQDFDIATAVADNGTLVCVYDRNAFKRLFILFDTRNGESWPRLREDESQSNPAVVAKWAKRYQQLLAENPDIPRNRLRTLAPEPISHQDWAGSYELVSDLGQAADGTARITSYSINIAIGEVWDGASIISVGHGSADSVRCTPQVHGDRLDLLFDSYRYEGNSPGEPLYYKGDLLLSLERTGPPDSPTYKGTWGKYRTVTGPVIVFQKVS